MSPSSVKDEHVIRYKSGNYVPIVAAADEHRIPDVPAKALGDRLHFPAAQAPGDWSQKVPEWPQNFDKGLSGEPTRLTQRRG